MASIGAGIRSLVVASGVVGERCYRDEAPADAAHPYAVFRDYLGDTVTFAGDGGNPLARRRILQVDLFFEDRDDEEHTAPTVLKAALSGATFTATDGKALRVRVLSVFRAFWHDAEDVRYVLDLRVDYLTTD